MLNEISLTEFEMQELGTRKILEYFEERLIELRIKNDNPKADRLTRGRIAEIKTFTKLMLPNGCNETTTPRNTMNY